jgi:protein-S-isoprenylcysteine O-methyltransferase Ste14
LPPSIPRWAALTLAPLVWLVAIPFAHVVAPWAISRLGPRYGWEHGSPGYWNSIGLLSVGAGAVVLVWLMILGFAQAAQVPERVQLDWSPKIFFKRGPYEFSRHPMYLAELALWLGWAIFYGSLSVLAGFAVFAIVVSRLGPIEERSLEARFGEGYRAYANDVPRWLRIRSRSSGEAR